MILVVLKKNADNVFLGFEVKGHAGQAPVGEDIVCAGVSAVVQTALIGLDEVAGIKNTYKMDGGYVHCMLPEKLNKDKRDSVAIILRTMELGLASIEEQYPEFVRTIVE